MSAGKARKRKWIDLGKFAEAETDGWKTSLDAAAKLGWEHHRVLQRCDHMWDPGSGFSAGFLRENTGEVVYADSCGRPQRAFGMTNTGYLALLLFCSGPVANSLREQVALRMGEGMCAEMAGKDGDE